MLSLRRFVLSLTVAVCALVPTVADAADKDQTFAIDQVMGKADAPITIIEYASTTCGHCATFIRDVLPKLKTEWLDTGKAKLIYRDFPTAPAGLSLATAMLPHCAGSDRYFAVLTLIMNSQDKWFNAEDRLATLKKLVGIAGISGDDVDKCLADKELAKAIMDRAKAGAEAFDIEATPTSVINGKVEVGLRPYPDLDKLLKEIK